MLQTTSRCNAACAFCPYPTVADSMSQGTMDDRLLRRIIDECSEHPVQRLMPYLMNEPLMDRRIVERINYAKRRNPRASVHILTNGSLLTERKGDELIDSALDWIGLSIHGHSEEAYRQAMGLNRELTYRRVERFIGKAACRRGPDFVMVTFNGGGAVTPREREAELAHFRALGVRRISYYGQSISRAGNVLGIAAPKHRRVVGCRSIWWPEMLHVLFNGDVILCCMDWRRRVVVGNLGQVSIAELWCGDRYREVRDRVWGRCPDDDATGDWPCSRCEEAIVEPLIKPKNVDAALVVLPCAMLDSDASMAPGVQLSLRAVGLEELLLDMSSAVHERLDDDHGYLWRRAGHGVVYHGDPSFELMSSVPDEIEWCVARARELPANHLVFPLVRSNSALTQEVVRRIREREPERAVLAFGSDEGPPDVLRALAVPYHRYVNRTKLAEWVARQAGRIVASEEHPPGPTAVAPLPVEPPWRPPGWEGTGAGMVPPAREELEPGALTGWLDSLGSLSTAAGRLWRHPLLAGQDLRRELRRSTDTLLGLVMSLRGRAPVDEEPSGVPGSITLRPPPRTQLAGPRLVPVEQPAAPAEEPPAPRRAAVEPALIPPEPDDSVWQRRPDRSEEVDVLLATLPPWGCNNPPVGLAHLATYVRSRGYHAELLDMNIDLCRRLGPEWELLWHVENKNYWSNDTTFGLLLDLLGPHLDRYADLIVAHPAPLVGFSVVDPKERCTIELMRRIKQRGPDKHILLGGPACFTPEYRRIFTDNVAELVDGYVMGEGEQALCDVIDALRAGATDLHGIPGVLCHHDGVDLPFIRRQRLTPLDRVPFPHYEDFDLDRYPGDELIVEWSRGCVGSCTFCKGKMIDGKYRSHSSQAIFDALRRYAGELGIRKLTVCDPVINGDVQVLEELCRLITADGLELQWRGEAIPHAGLTGGLLRSMRQAGCQELQLGLESGSDRVLELMNKRRLFCVEEAARVVRECHEVGIRTALFIIIGFPGEGEEEFQQTCRFVEQNAAYIDELKSINSLHIITGTPVHLHPQRYNLCLPEVDYHYRWSTSDGENTTEVRNDRVRRLMALAAEHDIFVRETNLAEGKHHGLAEELQQAERSRAELLQALQGQVLTLQSVQEPVRCPAIRAGIARSDA